MEICKNRYCEEMEYRYDGVQRYLPYYNLYLHNLYHLGNTLLIYSQIGMLNKSKHIESK